MPLENSFNSTDWVLAGARDIDWKVGMVFRDAYDPLQRAWCVLGVNPGKYGNITYYFMDPRNPGAIKYKYYEPITSGEFFILKKHRITDEIRRERAQQKVLEKIKYLDEKFNKSRAVPAKVVNAQQEQSTQGAGDPTQQGFRGRSLADVLRTAAQCPF